MSTTRHHINRRRRLEANSTRGERDTGGAALTATAAPEDTEPSSEAVTKPSSQPSPMPVTKPAPKLSLKTAAKPSPKPAAKSAAKPSPAPKKTAPGTAPESAPAAPTPRTARRRLRTVAGLCLLTLLLGAFAGWARAEVTALRDRPALRNTALTDPARTSDIKGQVSRAVGGVFSYDYANPGTSEKAAATYLTGKAVEQHRTLVSGVIAQAKRQKAVITTTVTDSAVERIDGDRARVLVFADQSSTGTSAKAQEPTYAGAMLAVDLVRKDGHWLISGIDTFGS
ncbi:hypothetical protein ACIQNU_30500 [Streptomyces sp. NPDC091292]|uniref:hypothetical protein n=1 Tax=Streptomyces sp. NPDC091292 TaxID=3365991 RepID=UPI003815BF7F